MLNTDRISDTFTTTGTGTITMTGTAPATFRSVYSAFNGQVNAQFNDTSPVFTYLAKLGADWELGRGYVTQLQMTTDSNAKIVRSEVIASSNANAAVNWPAGTKTLEIVASSTSVSGVGAKIGYGNVAGYPSLLIADGYGMGSFYYCADYEPMGSGTTHFTEVWFCTLAADVTLNWVLIWKANSRSVQNMLIAGEDSYRISALAAYDDAGAPVGDPMSHTMNRACTKGALNSAFNIVRTPYAAGTRQLSMDRNIAISINDGNVSGAANVKYVTLGLGISIVKGQVILMQEDDATKYRVYDISAVIRATQSGATTTSTVAQQTVTSVVDTSAGILSLTVDAAAQTNGMKINWGRSNAGTTAMAGIFDIQFVTTTADRADDGV